MKDCSLKPTTKSGIEKYPKEHLNHFKQLWEFKNSSNIRLPNQTPSQQILQQVDLSELGHVQAGVTDKQNYCWQVSGVPNNKIRVKLDYCETGNEIAENQQFDFDGFRLRSRQFPDYCLGMRTEESRGPLFLAWCYDNRF